MKEREFVDIDCPYCGESILIDIDCSYFPQSYTEDCSVCCQPINFEVNQNADDTIKVDVFHQNY